MADFKWTLSRPGISLEFETGSIKEALGLFEAESTQISEIFSWVPGDAAGETKQPETTSDKPAAQRGRPRKPAVEAVAPDPLPVPTAPPPAHEPPPSAAVLPVPSPLTNGELTKQVQEAITTGGVPPFLANQAAPVAAVAPPPPLPTISSPPVAPSPPPVGVLGPKVVKALDALREGKSDGGQALSDWLAASGLTIKGKSYDDACRAVLMISDEKLAPVAAALGVS